VSFGTLAFACLLLAATALLLHPARWLVDHYLPRRESGLPLAWFRIAWAAVLCFEVAQLAWYEPLLADPIPYLERSELHLSYALGAWLVALVCLGLGLFTRAAALVSYVMTLATLSTFEAFEYHVDYMITSVNLLLVFAPVSARLSLDRLLLLRRGAPAPSEVSCLYPLLLLLFGIGAIYADSVFYKFVSPMWLGGLGVWLPASMPQVAWLVYAPLLDTEWLVKGLGYLTLAFETVFVFLIWFRRLHPLLLVVGLGLHLGIAVSFPIPWFGLAAAAIYLLLVPAEWYEALGRWLPTWHWHPAGLSRALSRLAARLAWAPGIGSGCEPLASRGVLVALVSFLLVCQLVSTAQSPVVRRASEAVGLGRGHARLDAPARAFTRSVSRPLAGITPHGVFMDGHFRGYEHIVSVAHVDADGRETWLPIYDASGTPTHRTTGRVWVFWNWRVVGPRPDPARIARGLKRVTAYWAHRNGLSLDDTRFVVRAKRIEVPTGWQAGHLRRQVERPWAEVGRARWQNGSFSAELGDIESS